CESVDLVAKSDLGILTKKGESKDFTKKVEVDKNLELPVKKGTNLGKVKIYRGDKLIGEVELVSSRDIDKASYLQMLKRLFEDIV
ncbi:MAG: D-alanyl-D-alanine carboxypeptidase, partial [Intestinibacter sp.]